MNTVAIFSISTSNCLNQADVALKSLQKNLSFPVDIYSFDINDLRTNQKYRRYTKPIARKYRKSSQDTMRWSCKPAIILYLLNLGYERVIYIDNDIFFVNQLDFLISDTAGILLTPHFRPIFPSKDSDIFKQFLCLFTDGYFNAGFIYASQSGIPAIDWWYKMLLWKCEKNKDLSIYDDQKYLDTMSLQFSDIVEIIKHPGCNIAPWNRSTNIAEKINDIWKINKIYDPIFFHFSCSHNNQWKDTDPILWDYYTEFLRQLTNNNST